MTRRFVTGERSLTARRAISARRVISHSPYSGFSNFPIFDAVLATPGPRWVCVHAMNTPSTSASIAFATAGRSKDINSIFMPIRSTLITTALFSPSSNATAVARSGSRMPFAVLGSK